MTLLEAINEVLVSVGETPALTLDSGAADQVGARTVIEAEARKALVTGWAFNTDEHYPLAPDTNGRIAVPADSLKIVNTSHVATRDLVRRSGFMYDRKAGTDVIGESIEFTIIRDVPFGDVPYDTQRLIVARAKQSYQQGFVGSKELDEFNVAQIKVVDEDITEATALSIMHGIADTAAAKSFLEAEKRKVLAKGFYFNTDERFVIEPDSNGKLPVPADALSIDDLGEDDGIDLVRRGSFLWNKHTNSLVIGEPVACRVVRDMAFEDIPFDTQRLIRANAAKKYQQVYGGNAQLDAFAREELADAVASQADAEADSEDYNVLDNPNVMGELFRRTYRGGYSNRPLARVAGAPNPPIVVVPVIDNLFYVSGLQLYLDGQPISYSYT